MSVLSRAVEIEGIGTANESMKIAIIELLPAFFVLFPIFVLIRQYILLRSREFLIMGLAFISILFEILLDVLLGLNSTPNIESSIMDQSLYLVLIKIRYINFTLPSSLFYIIAHRSRRRGFWTWRTVSMFIWWITTVGFILSWEINEIPETATFLFITVYTTLPAGTMGAIFVNDYLVVGQGFELYLLLYQMVCLLYFVYSFLRIDNIFKYTYFKLVKWSWILMLLLYVAGNTFLILQTFNTPSISTEQVQMIQYISFIMIFFISIFLPEGLLLSYSQVSRLYHLYALDIEYSGDKRFTKFMTPSLDRTMDYLDQVRSSLEDQKDGENNHRQ